MKRCLSFTRQLAAISITLFSILPAQAQEAGLCPPSSQPALIQPEQTKQKPGDQRTYISADEAKVDSENVTTFSGKVKANQENKQLNADHVTYDRRSQDFEATGNVTFSTGEMQFQGDSASLNLETNQGVVKNTTYYTGTVNGRGRADQIIIENENRLVLDNASYTTCPPEKEAWRFTADEIKLDKSTRQGTASNMVLEISDIPVMYLPYVRFPIGDDRLSGFLFPSIGISNKHGTEISLPYYWNIHPQMDATIEPRNMTKRGLMLETELRYLTKGSNGNFTVEYLPDDKLYGEDRDKFAWQHSGDSNAGWSTSVNYSSVSDVDYISDFGGTLSTSTQTHLEQKGTLNYNSNYFLFSGVLQDYQNLSGEEPYKRLPQLKLDTRFSNPQNNFNYDLTSELVSFDHSDQSKVIGERLKVSPFVSYDFVKDAGFFKPKLSVNYLEYNLDNPALPTQSETPSVTVPIFSIDSGIFLERDTEIAGSSLLHTLEPRLFYLYAPYRDQSELPVFDTALTTFSSSSLFSENRFSGNDRIGDANQLTAALTTRFYRKQDGNELFNATIGQIFYFDDRQVTLPGQPIETDTRSSYIGGLGFYPHRYWRFSGDIQWSPTQKNTEVGNARIQYTPGKGRVVNMDYRFRRNELRTQGLNLAWRFNPAWQAFGGHLYDLQNDHVLEQFLGFRYDSCCWAVRLVGKKLFDRLETSGELRFENAIFLEFELKGLSSLGSRRDIDTTLENGILGYSE